MLPDGCPFDFLSTMCQCWYCRGSLLRHTWTKKFIEQFTQHRYNIINQDVSTVGLRQLTTQPVVNQLSANEDPQVETSWFIIWYICCVNCSINFFVHVPVSQMCLPLQLSVTHVNVTQCPCSVMGLSPALPTVPTLYFLLCISKTCYLHWQVVVWSCG